MRDKHATLQAAMRLAGHGLLKAAVPVRMLARDGRQLSLRREPPRSAFPITQVFHHPDAQPELDSASSDVSAPREALRADSHDLRTSSRTALDARHERRNVS
eukprot:gene17070-1307_t